MKLNWKSLLNLMVLALLPLFPFDRPANAWQRKADPWVLQNTAAGQTTEFIVYLTQQADLSPARRLAGRAQKGAYVYQQLSQTAAASQKPILQTLERWAAQRPGQVEYRSYWVANMIWVRGDADLAQALAARPDVAHLYANPQVRLEAPGQPRQDTRPSPRREQAAVEWNLAKVGAPGVWAAGFTGQGVVIGGQDTGYRWDHPALKPQYLGWNGTAADHNYHWHDAIHTGGGACGADAQTPCDDHYHGTHTMGIMVGDDGGDNQTGMAPGARWIGCRDMNQGIGSPITYAECFQWFIAPTNLQNQNPRPDLAPDIVNNSWSCPPDEGCTDPQALLQVVENVRAAGILTVQSAGNTGPECSSIDTPAAIYAASFTVGNTTTSDAIASNSSRGPATVDGSGRVKPDISAPGTSIRSALPSGYGWLSGTSMAAPHVAGLAALLISARPDLAGKPDLIETLIEQNAVHLTSNELCGGVSGQSIPNNTFGWGRIDALKTVQAALPPQLTIHKRASASVVRPGDLLTYTLTVNNTSFFTHTYAVQISDTLPEHTAFINATLPFWLIGDVIRWDFTSLGPTQGVTVSLVVQATGQPSQTIVNQVYAARSQEAPLVSGLPVTTTIRAELPILRDAYLPVVAK